MTIFPLDVTVELFISGAWVDVTSDVLVRDGTGVRITRGRSDEAGQVQPTRVELSLRNTGGKYSPRNPASPYYGLLGRNTPLRVSVFDGVATVVRASVEVAAWPARWDTSGRDVWVPVEGAGILRRLGQGATPLKSPLYREVIDDTATMIAYWPLEDGSDATQFAAASANTVPATFYGTVRPAGYTDIPGSAPLPLIGTGGTILAPVPAYSSIDSYIQFVMFIPAAGLTNNTGLINFWTSGSAMLWALRYTTASGGSLSLEAVDSTLTLIDATAANAFGGGGMNGYRCWVKIQLVQNGADVDLAVSVYKLDDRDQPIDPGVTVTDTFTGVTCGTVTKFYFLSTMADCAVGHLSVGTDVLFVFDPVQAMAGYTGEAAGTRMARLCLEEGVPFTNVGSLAATEPMGPQQVAPLLTLLRDAEAVDAGVLYEPRDTLGLAYRTRVDLYNQTAAVGFDYAAKDLAPPLEPVDDDQHVRNDITATRIDGSSARFELETGPLSTQDPPDGVGRYDEQVTVNAATDNQLKNLAAWRVHVGTVDEARYPLIRVNQRGLDSRGKATLLRNVAATDLGDLATIDNPPAWLPPDQIRQLVQGHTEALDSVSWDVWFNSAPASPWTVFEIGSAVDNRGRLASGGSILDASLTTGATSVKVRPPDVTDNTFAPYRWTTTAADFVDEFLIVIGGEVMAVSAIANSPSFVNAGAAAHADNASVVPGLPASLAQGDIMFLLAVTRGAGTPDTPAGYSETLSSIGGTNAKLYRKTAGVSESAPTVSFTGGAAGDTCSAQICAFRNLSADRVGFSVTQANASAQDIDTPVFRVLSDNTVVMLVAHKADDWTNVSTPSGFSQIGEPSSTLGNDQGIYWGFQLQANRRDIPPLTVTVTGGAAAVSGSRLIAFQGVQTMTVTRSVNGVVKAHTAGAAVQLYRPPVVAR